MTTPTNPNEAATAPSFTASIYGTADAAKRAEDEYYEQRARAFVAAQYGDDPTRAQLIFHGKTTSADLRRGIAAVAAALRTAGHRDSAELPATTEDSLVVRQPSAPLPLDFMRENGVFVYEVELADDSKQRYVRLDDFSRVVAKLTDGNVSPAPRSDDAPRELVQQYSREDDPERFGYVIGWNACREAMLIAPREVALDQQADECGRPMTYWGGKGPAPQQREGAPLRPVTDDIGAIAEAVRTLPPPLRGLHEGWRVEEIWEWATREAAKTVESHYRRLAGESAT